MKKALQRIVLIVIVLIVAFGSVCYAQEEGTANTKKHKTFAIGFDPVQFGIGMIVNPPVTILSGNVELAVMKKFSLLANFTYAASVNAAGFQAGGGVRYYFDHKGLMNLWAGGYCDYMLVENLNGIEAGMLIGYKKVFGPLFFDPFFGLRYVTVPDVSYIHFGLIIGLVF